MKAATALAVYIVKKDKISIHAAREGGDSTSATVETSKTQISIHAAREGGDA